MAHAYTPGLRTSLCASILKKRVLSLVGEVVVKKGQKVLAEDVIATAKMPGNVHIINVINQLGITPAEVKEYMLKKEGEAVKKGEVIAETKPLIKFFKTKVLSPAEGVIENISDVTGQVILREPPKTIELRAYIDGVIQEVIENLGAEIFTYATFVQGIFGIGGERWGLLDFAVSSPDEVLTEDKIKKDFRDKIVVGGSQATLEALNKAREIGVKGIIVGGVDAQDIVKILGYDIGVAITGHENIDFTLILTEGFGRIPMAKRTFEILYARRGKKASINGATQIRAGVMRPEIIISLDASEIKDVKDVGYERGSLKVNDIVRIIREPYFGKIGYVKSLPPELLPIETESKVRVLEVELMENKQVVVVPRANVEIMEE